ncbi:MAG: hypothetical protein U0804_24475 [Gemmataceae bacterium]
MATDTAAAPVTRPAPPRRLWQVPTFLVGAAAFVAAYQGLIPIHGGVGATFEADLAALVGSTERVNPDARELKAALDRVAAEVMHYPELAPRAHAALGGGYARLAELTTDGGEARGYWVLARQHFTAGDESKLPDPERVKFIFRRAKSQAADPPSSLTPAEFALIRAILNRPPLGEDPGEAPRLGAELSLRVTPPDLKAAKDGLTSYLTNAGLGTPPATLTRAKLRLSEVHLALGDPDGAKQWLTAIGADAPADVLPSAKAQLARIRMSEQDWAGAAREWEAARAAELPQGLRSMSAYYLAECRVRLKADDADAVRLLDEAAKSSGPEGPAAAVKLVGLTLRNPDATRRKAAAAYLPAAAKAAKGGLVPAVEVQAAFEQAVQVLTTDGAFPEAVAAAEAYAPVAVGGREREKKAEVLTAWGAALEKAGADGKARYAAAAAEYSAVAAALPPDQPYRAEQLRLAASLQRKAGNPTAGLEMLKQAAATPRLPDEVAGPIWAEYADGLLAANRPADALVAFKRALDTGGPTSTAVRHKLARNLIDSRDPKKLPLGIELLEQIAQAERVSPAEQEYQEKAFVELANEAIQARDFQKAEARLRTQLRLYANGPEAGQGKLLLGTALLQRIDPRAKVPAPDADKAGEEALKLLKEVLTEVDARKVANRPATSDPWLRTQAQLRVLLAQVLLRKPYDVLTTADPIRREYAGKVEELIVLSMMYHGYLQLNNDEGRLTVEAQMRDTFAALKEKPNGFPARSGEYSRDYWEREWPSLIQPKR